MLKDCRYKEVLKMYRKLMTTSNEYQKFQLIERIDPTMAKEVLMCLAMNKRI